MAVPWQDFVVAATALDGFATGSVADIDEFPPSSTDQVATGTVSGGGSTTVGLNFDMSASPGVKKGFWFHFWPDCTAAGGFDIDEVRLIDENGPTTLWSDSSPGLAEVNVNANGIMSVRIPDSAFSGDPAIDDLTVELDITNNHGSGDVFQIHWARLSKSPFTEGQEAPLPPQYAGLDYAAYRKEGLLALGVENDEEIVVWPDGSGNGRHFLRSVGSGQIVFKTADGGYVDCPTNHDTRFIWRFSESPIVENIVTHIRHYPYDVDDDHPIITAVAGAWSGSGAEFDGVLGAGSPGEKIVHGYTNGDYLLMTGDGSGGAHLVGGSPAENTWERSTMWHQISGNEHMYVGATPTEVIDGASGSNRLHAGSAFHHEASNREFDGRVSEIYIVVVPAASIDETDVINSHLAWEAGLSNLMRDQEGYRWRNDDGSETTATWMAAQDSGITIPASTPARLRVLVDTGGEDPLSSTLTLQYKRTDEPDTEWRNV